MADTNELLELLDKATPGPWEATERGGYSDFDGNSRVIIGDDMRIGVIQTTGREDTEANAELAALAPDLAREVIALRAEVARLRPIAQRIVDDVTHIERPDALSGRTIHFIVHEARAALTPTTGDKETGQ